MFAYSSALPSTWFQQLLLITGLYYGVASRKLSMVRPAAHFRGITSYGLTLLLLCAGLVGSLQVIQIAGQTRGTGSAQSAAPAVVIPAAEKKDSTAASGMPASIPDRLRIPSIELDAPVAGVGLNPDGTLGVPHHDYAGWYTGSPTPGEIGPAVFPGHVDSAGGIGVFWRLRELTPGAEMLVSRQDGSTVRFLVEKLETYEQAAFPTEQVYGNIDYAGVRLITCAGDFNFATRQYSHNLVVYGRMAQ